MPPSPADFIHARACKPFCEKSLTLPFLGAIFQNRPTVDVHPQKRAKEAKTAFLIKIGKLFCHFLDTGREMIFDCPSGMSWGLTGEGGVLEKQENITASQNGTHVL